MHNIIRGNANPPWGKSPHQISPNQSWLTNTALQTIQLPPPIAMQTLWVNTNQGKGVDDRGLRGYGWWRHATRSRGRRWQITVHEANQSVQARMNHGDPKTRQDWCRHFTQWVWLWPRVDKFNTQWMPIMRMMTGCTLVNKSTFRWVIAWPTTLNW